MYVKKMLNVRRMESDGVSRGCWQQGYLSANGVGRGERLPRQPRRGSAIEHKKTEICPYFTPDPASGERRPIVAQLG